MLLVGKKMRSMHFNVGSVRFNAFNADSIQAQCDSTQSAVYNSMQELLTPRVLLIYCNNFKNVYVQTIKPNFFFTATNNISQTQS